jgi:hypothetical protein
MQGFAKATNTPIQSLLEVDDRVSAPHMVLKSLPRDEFSGLCDEECQHSCGLRLEADCHTALPQFSCFTVEFEFTEAESHGVPRIVLHPVF